jgi:hypothetical protein
MQVISVPAARVVIDPVDRAERTFDVNFCKNGLAMSIQDQGLLNERIVQPVAGRPGHYAVRPGRSRQGLARRVDQAFEPDAVRSRREPSIALRASVRRHRRRLGTWAGMRHNALSAKSV